MDSPPLEALFDEYLTQLSMQLVEMPEEQHRELRQLLRQHLEAWVAAQQELGSSLEEAVAATLCRFGDPVQLGRWLSREWRRRSGWSYVRVMSAVIGAEIVAIISVVLGHYLEARTPGSMGIVCGLGILVAVVSGEDIGRAIVRPILWFANRSTSRSEPEPRPLCEEGAHAHPSSEPRWS